MEIEKNWQEIFGQPMSAEVSNRILKIQKALGIKDDDALWQVLIPLEYYQRIFEQFPEKARKEAEEVARELRKASIAVTEASAAVVKESRDKAVVAIGILESETKKNISDAVGKTLETEIREAVNQLKSQSNRPLHKKWLIAASVVLLVGIVSGGWGFWALSNHYKNVGAADIAAYANPVSKSFFHLMKCDQPGWKKQWITNAEGKKLLGCYPYKDPKLGQFGWDIAP